MSKEMNQARHNLLIATCVAAAATTAVAWGQAPRVGKEQAAPAPKTDVNTLTPAAKPMDPAVGVPGVNPTSYVIGGEDVLFIKTWRMPDFTFPAVVRPDGMISVPLVGEMSAAGKTPAMLEKELAAALGNFIQKPDVSVTVTDVRSKKYYVTGEVLKSGEFALVGPTTIMQAVVQCGFQPFANKKKIRILRKGATLSFNYEDAIKARKVSKGSKNTTSIDQNALIENGDYIVVQ